MNIFVIVIEFYVNLKNNFQIGLSQILFILHDFNQSTTLSPPKQIREIHWLPIAKQRSVRKTKHILITIIIYRLYCRVETVFG